MGNRGQKCLATDDDELMHDLGVVSLRWKGAKCALLEEFTSATFNLKTFYQALDAWCEPWRLQPSPPWLVGWYNDSRDATAGGLQHIEADSAAVAFAICSVPRYIDVVAEHFARVRPDGNFVDAATNEIIELLRDKLNPELNPFFVNTDVGPPYYHVQSIGAVAGLDQHLEDKDIEDAEWCEDLRAELEDTRDPKMWGTDPVTRRKIFGVNVHPTYGGWYSYRILLVLRGITENMLAHPLARPEPLKFLDQENAKRILREYNLQHDRCVWRDLTDNHPAYCRYSAEEYFYFTETQPAKRKRFLELKASQFTSPPARRANSKLPVTVQQGGAE